jgi:hypothetical protein
MKVQQNQEMGEGFMTEASLKDSLQEEYDMSLKNPQSGMSSYYIATQVDIYDSEVDFIRATLEGKILVKEGAVKKFVYPKEIAREIQFVSGYKKNREPIVSSDFFFDVEISKFPEGSYELTGRTRLQEVIKPFCNTDGQREILNFAAPRVSGGTVLSVYTENSVMGYTLADGIILASMIRMNMDKWNIDPTRMTSVVMTICDRIDAARRRGVDGKASEQPSKSQRINIIESKGDKPNLPFLGGGQKSNL